nr:NAD(P)-binding domain-containing protein [uncultured Rhodoferax sp.]
MHIAIIGLGEVGQAYARALQAAGHTLQLCNARAGAAAQSAADALGLPLHLAPGAWLGTCDWVLLCVTGSAAPQVLAQCAPWVPARTTMCDMTTASPQTKRASAALAREQGLQYLDVAIMGAVALGGHTTPLLVAGDGAAAFQVWMQGAGGKVRVIDGGAAGDAMALKILRSTFTKGLEALSVELLMAAERQGVRDKLYAQLQDIDDTPLRAFIDMLVRTHVVHAKRRALEVQEAAGEMAHQGIPSLVLPGVGQRFHKTVAGLEAHPLETTGPTTEEALQWLLQREG